MDGRKFFDFGFGNATGYYDIIDRPIPDHPRNGSISDGKVRWFCFAFPYVRVVPGPMGMLIWIYLCIFSRLVHHVVLDTLGRSRSAWHFSTTAL